LEGTDIASSAPTSEHATAAGKKRDKPAPVWTIEATSSCY
jgi:hypothetical protein